MGFVERSQRRALLAQWDAEVARVNKARTSVDAAFPEVKEELFDEYEGGLERLLQLTDELVDVGQRAMGLRGALTLTAARESVHRREGARLEGLTEYELQELLTRQSMYDALCEDLATAVADLMDVWYQRDRAHFDALAEVRRLLHRFIFMMSIARLGREPEPEDFFDFNGQS
jgi:hypothetical protein